MNKLKKNATSTAQFYNLRKTQIVKLSRTFSFLKVRWTLTATGKVIKRLNPDTITRERRKLKKLKSLLDEGKITMDIIESQYQSWKGDKGKGKPGKRITFNSYHTLQRMDQLYNELFINKTNQGGIINE